MRNREMKQMMALASRLTLAQRRELMAALAASQASAESVVVIEGRVGAQPICAHCQGRHVVRNGQADGLQRYKCRNCGKTFNALTGTPLARLRHKGKWLTQAAVLQQGLSIVKAAEQLEVAPSTAFRWRHRFLALPQTVKARELTGIAEADETYMLHSCKGQRETKRKLARKSRRRGGKASNRGLSKEQVVVLVARDRAGCTTDFILEAGDKSHIVAALRSVLAPDALLCTDGGTALAAAARQMGVEHHSVNLSAGVRVDGPWHVQNVNAYHGRLKQWMRRFNGVATSYLGSYLGWFRALDRSAKTSPQPAHLLALAIGASAHP